MKQLKRLDLHFIKMKREELNLTHQEMAEKLGFKNGSTYFKYENGSYSFKADQLPELADALGCKVSDFYTHNVAETAIKNTHPTKVG